MNQTPSSSHVSSTATQTRRSLRIAFVTESYPPEINGVANTVERVVEGLHACRHEVQLVRPRQGPSDAARQRDGFEEVLTGGMAIPMYGQLRLGLPSAGRLTRLWSVKRPDVVHIATEGPLGWSALRAASDLKLPVCSDFRTNFHAYSQFYGIKWLRKPITRYLRHFHNRCHSTMVPTDALRRELASEGFSPLTVIARGVDTTLFSPQKRNAMLREDWGVGERGLAVLYVGRLAAEKNLGLLLQAFEQIRVHRPSARLVVVGDGPTRSAMRAQCPDAIFTGFQRGEDLAACYASSDLFLFPSLTETFGNVTTEAMASGLALVAFDDAAAGQLVRHGRNGMLARKDQPGDFLRLSTQLACNPELRRWLGTQARETALPLGWDSIVQGIEEQYVAAMARTHAASLPRVWMRASGI